MSLFLRRRGNLTGYVGPIVAVGGDDVFDEEIAGVLYRIHVFTTVGSSQAFEVQNVGGGDGGLVEYLIIGSGGTAGTAGGGGAGGYRCSVVGEQSGGLSAAEPRFNVAATTYPVVVGAGGTGYTAPGQTSAWPTGGSRQGPSGSPSSVFGIEAAGGGGGGAYHSTTNFNGAAGGSGGGGGWSQTGTRPAGGAPTSGQGFVGGTGQRVGDGSLYKAGGGGGAGQAGAGSNGTSGNGGSGITSNITGTPTTRAGGGGGGAQGRTAGTGGAGGGGNGTNSTSQSFQAGVDGQANTGGGGGGMAISLGYSGAGGSGIVIIRYPL